MTTIAVKDGVMATDSQLTSSYIHPHNDTKVKRIGDALLGFSGTAAACEAFEKWFRKGAKPSKFPDICSDQDMGCAVLALTARGIALYHLSGHPVKVGKMAALGSGQDFAMGAMLAGADAKEAVKVASKLCPYTGGRIVTRTL